MIHFLYLIGFALIVSVIFGIIENGDMKQKLLHGVKVFAQFIVISLVLGWIFYFLPWK